MGKADLHMHTNASDGKETVEERALDASKQGFETVAITDHDIINTDLNSREQTINGVNVITGAEITCDVRGTGIEILGYFLDPEDEKISAMLDKARKYRTDRLKQMTCNIDDVIEQNLEWNEVEEYIGDVAVKPHLAEALNSFSLVETENDAFREFLSSGCETYVSAEKLPADQVIDTIHQNGGVAVLAHPGRDLTKEGAEDKIEELVEYGLDGIEVPYTYQHKLQEGYGIDFEQLKAKDLQEEFELLISGGSDCHGKGSGKYNLGKIELDSVYVDALRARAERC